MLNDIATGDFELAHALVSTLPESRPDLFNPYSAQCRYATEVNTPASRLARLALHLDCDARLVLLGEAVGYKGARYSGVTFTSEKQLVAGAIPRIPVLQHRLSQRDLPFSEPSATIVWRTLYELGLTERTILWNALQVHPHKLDQPWSNRTPTADELRLGAPAFSILRDAFPNAKLVAVGQKAAELLGMMNIRVDCTVRHPANGGATKFAEGMRVFSQANNLTLR